MMRIGIALTLVLSFLSTSTASRADTVHNVATALDYAGFDIRGSHNPLSGGTQLLVSRQFTGNFFDFGAADLSLQGPISLQVSTGGRLLPTVDVALTTALNGQLPPSTLNYNFDSFTGPQSTSVSGSTLIDADLTINALGFYDLTLTSSTRKTVDREGIVTETDTIDSDVGPITVRGNIIVDALAVVTDPFFEQSGKENPFSEMAKLIDLGASKSHSNQRLDHLDPFHPSQARLDNNGAIVPEPTVLVLLLLGLPVIVNRTWRVR